MKIDGGSGPEDASPAPSPQRLDQQRHELPLRAARVLELVDEHVVIARLEAVAALRELVHLPQQLERPLEHVCEIENRVRIQRAAVLASRAIAIHAEDAARHQHIQVPFVRDRRRPSIDAAWSRPGRDALPMLLSDTNCALLNGIRLRGSPSSVRKCSRARANAACTNAGFGGVPSSMFCSSRRRSRASSRNGGSGGPDARKRVKPAGHLCEDTRGGSTWHDRLPPRP